MVHGKNRIPYWIDRRLNGLAGPEYHATISFGLPFESEDSQYGESRSIVPQIYDDAQTQGGIRIHTAGSDDARWCRVTGPAGQTEAIGDVTVDDVLDADTAFFFNGLSPTGLEVVSLIFEQLEIATPCTKWQRLMRKYVEYLHTAERGEWTQEKPSPRK